MNTEPKNIEMYYLLSICLMVIAIVGVFHSPVFGLFEVRMTQTVLYALTGVSLVSFAELFRRDLTIFTKALSLFYGILSVVGFFVVALHISFIPLTINGADNALHMFIASILWYLGTSERELISTTHETIPQ